jgi:hypothetical protein
MAGRTPSAAYRARLKKAKDELHNSFGKSSP